MLRLTLKLLITKAKLTLARLGYGIIYAILRAKFTLSLFILKMEYLWVTLKISILSRLLIANGFRTTLLLIKKYTSVYKSLD